MPGPAFCTASAAAGTRLTIAAQASGSFSFTQARNSTPDFVGMPESPAGAKRRYRAGIGLYFVKPPGIGGLNGRPPGIGGRAEPAIFFFPERKPRGPSPPNGSID